MSLFVTMILGMVAKMYMPRALGAENMGLIFFAETFPVIFFSFLPLGIISYIQKHIPSEPNHAKEIMYSILVFEFAFSLILTVIMATSLVFMGYNFETSLLTLIMAGFYVASIVGKGIFRSLFLAQGKSTFAAMLDIYVKVIFVGLILLTLFLYPNLYLIALGYLISEALGVFVFFYFAVKDGAIHPPFRFDLLKKILLVSLPFFFIGVFTQIYASTDATILSKFSNNVEVGLYGAASRLKGVFLLLIPIVQSSLIPIMSKTLKDDEDKYTNFSREIFKVIMVLSAPLTYGMIVFGQDASVILYGAEFLASGRITAFLAPVLTLTYINTFLSMNLILSTNGRKMAVVVSASVIINIGLNILFIPYGDKLYGQGGAASAVSFATFLSEFLVMIGLAVISPIGLLDRERMLTMILIMAPCIPGIYYFADISSYPLWERILIFSVAVPAYGFLTRMVKISEFKALYGLYRRSPPQ